MKITTIYTLEQNVSARCPLFITRVAAGFPSPAEDYIDQQLDLNQYLIKHPAATFYVRVSGDSMINAGIFSNDLLIVDRSQTATNGSIVIAVINGEMTVKRLVKHKKYILLAPENEKYHPIKVTEDMDFEIWGVVSYVIHKAE